MKTARTVAVSVMDYPREKQCNKAKRRLAELNKLAGNK